MSDINPPAPQGDMLTAALGYYDLGWSIIPLQPRAKIPIEKSWQEYGKQRATRDQIVAWWGRWPNANIGLVTGRVSGLFALDVDGEAGIASLQGKHSPITPTTNTANGNHRLYKYPDEGEVRNRVAFLPGLDIRGEGGQVVLPPSIHPSGIPYEWMIPPDVEKPAGAPAWVLEAAVAQPGRRAANTGPTGAPRWMEALHLGASSGGRNDAMTAIAGHYIGLGLPEDEVMTICLSLNVAKFNPPLADHEVETIVMSIGRTHERNRASDDLIGNDQKKAAAARETPGNSRRDIARNAVSIAISGPQEDRLVIEQAIKYRTDPPRYDLVINSIRVSFKAIEQLIEQRPFRMRVADETGLLPEPIGRERWPKVAQALLDSLDEREVEEATDLGELRAQVTMYLEDNPPRTKAEILPGDSAPWEDEAGIYISTTDIRFYLFHRWGERVTSGEIALLLRRFHATPVRHNRRSYWRIPPGLLDHDPTPDEPVGHA